MLEVDLKYPRELHNWHNDYPLAPEKLKISQNKLSNIILILLMNISGVNKLVPNLSNKRKLQKHSVVFVVERNS